MGAIGYRGSIWTVLAAIALKLRDLFVERDIRTDRWTWLD